jgi:endoribonuclease Dicer
MSSGLGKVYFSTAAVLLNLLKSREVSLSDASLVVFDEAHHCRHNHPFNQIMRDFYWTLDPQSRPRVRNQAF